MSSWDKGKIRQERTSTRTKLLKQPSFLDTVYLLRREEDDSVSAHHDCPHPAGLAGRPVLLRLCGGRLPRALHQCQQPVLLQLALARHRTGVRVLPPVDMDGPEALQT